MSNLGWYQIITTAASKVGGVPKLIGIIFGSGIFVGCGATVGICSLVENNKSKRELKKKMKLKSINYSVHTSITNNNGFTINAGDQYKIIEIIFIFQKPPNKIHDIIICFSAKNVKRFYIIFFNKNSNSI